MATISVKSKVETVYTLELSQTEVNVLHEAIDPRRESLTYVHEDGRDIAQSIEDTLDSVVSE